MLNQIKNLFLRLITYVDLSPRWDIAQLVNGEWIVIETHSDFWKMANRYHTLNESNPEERYNFTEINQ